MSWDWWTTPAQPRRAYLIYFAMVMFIFMACASPLWINAGLPGAFIGTVSGYFYSHWIVKGAMEYDKDDG
ncbi:MAG: hypothetical protein AAGH82_06065 [Pseudomonadota bacterium]